MRRLIYIFLSLITLLGVGCSQRKIIPDGELAQIFHDAFLVNAYTTIKSTNLDSLNIYEPIFERYGYTTEDIHYTIGNFSKRKSARLGDVVERAIAMLEFEGVVYDEELKILDTISAIAQRSQRRVLLDEAEFVVDSQSDTLDLVFTIEGIEVGEYVIEFDYLIDSLDKNYGNYRTIMWFERDNLVDGEADDYRHQETLAYLQRDKVLTSTTELKVTRAYDRMIIHLIDLMRKKNDPHMKFRDLKVVHTPPTDISEQRLFEELVNVKIFSDELLPPPPPTDSL